MRDMYRPARPVARLLVVALGLLGIVVGPAGSGTHGGTSPTGTISGVRTGAAQNTPARTRSATKQRLGARPQAQPAAQAAAQAAPVAFLAHASYASYASYVAQPPSSGQQYVAQPSFAVLPASSIESRPPSWRAVRAVPGHDAPDVAPAGVPRGRAPPSSPRI
ncbi:hypothetical protein OHR68_24205 [Spirillospora sp. NBC_00431]